MKKKKSLMVSGKTKKSKSSKTPIKFLVTFLLGLFGASILFSLIKGYWPVVIAKVQALQPRLWHCFWIPLGWLPRVVPNW